MVDHDVAVVGGGPAGCTAAIFTARYGLDTVVFDRGTSSLAHCGLLENYPGFPGGIDVATYHDLLTDHADAAGATLVDDLIEAVERTDDGEGFVLSRQSGDSVTAARVVAATRYDGEYLRPLGGDDLFETIQHHGEDHEQFDRSYPDADGRTPIEGLYVASPTEMADRQVVMAAGQAARVAHALIEDVRQSADYPAALRSVHDWVRALSDIDEEWTDRDRWREWVDNQVPADADIGEQRLADIREMEVDRLLDTCLEDADIHDRERAGQRRLLTHLDDELVVERAHEIADGEDGTLLADGRGGTDGD